MIAAFRCVVRRSNFSGSNAGGGAGCDHLLIDRLDLAYHMFRLPMGHVSFPLAAARNSQFQLGPFHIQSPRLNLEIADLSKLISVHFASSAQSVSRASSWREVRR